MKSNNLDVLGNINIRRNVDVSGNMNIKNMLYVDKDVVMKENMDLLKFECNETTC